MKKIAYLAVLTSLSLVSCKKDYTCTCTVTNNSSGSNFTVSSITKAESNKKDAEAWCDASGKATTTTNGVNSSAGNPLPTCKIN